MAILALLPPWVLIYLVSGWEGVTEAWPLAIVGSLSYIVGQWPVAHFLGPYLPDLSGALVSFWVLFLFVKIWRPKTIRGFGGDAARMPPASEARRSRDGICRARRFTAWMPYLVLILVVVAWTGPWSHLPGDQFVQAVGCGKIFGHAEADFLDVQLHAVRRRHVDPGFLAGDSADPAAERASH